MKSNQFTPLDAQMLIKYDKRDRSEGGILFVKPENTWEADVIRAGAGCEVKVGERVMMSLYRGENLKFEDGSFTVVNERDAMAVLEN